MSWQLSTVRHTPESAGGDAFVEFKREVIGGGRGALDGSTGKAWEYKALVCDTRGRTWLYQLGTKQSAKGKVQQRRKALANRAIAYVAMMGSVEGFPLQTEI